MYTAWATPTTAARMTPHPYPVKPPVAAMAITPSSRDMARDVMVVYPSRMYCLNAWMRAGAMSATMAAASVVASEISMNGLLS